MGSATPSHTGDTEHNGIAAGGRPGPAPKTKDCRSGRVGASFGGMSALGGSLDPTKVPGEGTNPCTRPSFATKNVLMCSKIFPRASEDHPDRSWMLQMGSLSPLSTICTSRLSSFWNGRRS